MSGDANTNDAIFSTLEIDTIGEIMNISMGSAATAASTLLDNKVTITTPVVNIVDFDVFEIAKLEPAVAVEIQYVEGITGSNILILSQDDVKTILAQMMQSELPDNYVIDEMAQSAICELMNQMMGSSATVLSCFLGRPINISTPVTVPIPEWADFKKEHFPQNPQLLTITFTISIENVMESEFVSVMDLGLAKEIINVSLNFDSEGDSALTPPPAPPMPEPAPPTQEFPQSAMPFAPAPAVTAPPQQPVPMPQQPIMPTMPMPQQPMPAMMPQQPYPTPPPQGSPYPQYASPAYPPPGYPLPPAGYGYPQPAHTPDPILIKGYEYGDLGDGSGLNKEQPGNLDLVMNVPVSVTVELGRCKRKIKEVLEFGQGTIVELDKQAGSQVDVIVNGQLIARGDVVVVDDNFSIRITEILKARDSLTMM